MNSGDAARSFWNLFTAQHRNECSSGYLSISFARSKYNSLTVPTFRSFRIKFAKVDGAEIVRSEIEGAF